ncbi:hypothetical protein F8M41_019588 [Gigaspora margarita]|uniref:Uncharacterized protein n=1 Tax=Gigaspora margarita TaxID=4874 RepID=A0A8H4EU81_GIGMA|nr:hypothetical protein F8M41_019588 [Gigaspora margarita]
MVRKHNYQRLHQKLRKKRTNSKNKSDLLGDVTDGKKKNDNKIESRKELRIKKIEDRYGDFKKDEDVVDVDLMGANDE